MVTFQALLESYKSCRIGKRPSIQQICFETRLGENLLKLANEINRRTYHPSRYLCFIVTHPKPREVFAANFRDRIVHHFIVARLEPMWERKFSPVSFACRDGLGTHGALSYFRRKTRSISQGGRKPVYALQLDIEAFFASIHRPTLRQLLRREAQNETVRWLIDGVFRHDPRINVVFQGPSDEFARIPQPKSWFSKTPDEGIAIGNLTSQFGANVYLTELDLPFFT